MRPDPAAFTRLRLEAGLSRAELAERAGVGRITIYRIEVGKHVPRMATVRAIAWALGVPVTDLLVADEVRAAS